VNDDSDLDARLRAGARAFPPAPTPDSGRLRDVLTTSRRRRRRAQGSVLACATAAVAGGAVWAVREPQATQSVEVAAPESTTTAPVPPAPPGSVDEQIRDYICGPEHFSAVTGEPSPYLLYLAPTEAGGELPADLEVRIDGFEVLVSAPPGDPHADPIAPATSPEGAPPLWTLVVVGSSVMGEPLSGAVASADVVVVLSPVELPARELEITAGGVTSVLELSSHDLAPAEVVTQTIEAPGVVVEWVTVGALCSSAAVDPAPPTTVESAATTSVQPPVTTPPTTTLTPPPTRGPSDELAPEGGPAAPTTSTMAPPPGESTSTVLSAPPTTVP
jgi:hypothetical protein